jgi:uncharacterized protein YkwD
VRVDDEHLTRPLLVLVGGLAVVLALTLLLTTGASATRGPDRAAAENMLTWVNEERALHGLPPFAGAPDVALVAERWSADMALRRELEHNPRYAEQLCCWELVAENVAFSDPYATWRPGDPVERVTEELHLALLDSPSHRENLLHPDLDEIGIGVHVHDDGSVWITQNFRAAAP